MVLLAVTPIKIVHIGILSKGAQHNKPMMCADVTVSLPFSMTLLDNSPY